MFFGYEPVFALPLLYLDPGSGSFIIQLILGAGLGLAVGAKLYWSKIKQVFSGHKAPETQAPPNQDMDEG